MIFILTSTVFGIIIIQSFIASLLGSDWGQERNEISCMKTQAGNANQVCLRFNDIKMSLPFLLMLLYILMTGESGTLGHSGLWFVLFAKMCLCKNIGTGVIMHPADGENEVFLFFTFTCQDWNASEPQRGLQTTQSHNSCWICPSRIFFD